MELGKVPEPLHDFRDRLLLGQDLYNEEALKGNIHSSQTGNLLSGAPLDSFRDVEVRIESASKGGRLEGWRPSLATPNIPRPADGIPQDIADHMRLMSDIMVLGFQTDSTRVGTLKLNNDHSSGSPTSAWTT